MYENDYEKINCTLVYQTCEAVKYVNISMVKY